MDKYKAVLFLFWLWAAFSSCIESINDNIKNDSFFDAISTTLDSSGIKYVYLDTSWTFDTRYYSKSKVKFYHLKDSIYHSTIKGINTNKETIEWITKTEFSSLEELRLNTSSIYCDSNYSVLGAPIYINEDTSLLIVYFNTYFFCEHKSTTTLPIVYQYQSKDKLWKPIDTFSILVPIQEPIIN